MNLQNKNITELKNQLKKYDLVSNVSSLKKDDLIKNLRAVMKYKENNKPNNNDDYKTLYFGDKKVTLSDEQHRIVVSRMDQNIRVLAAAGSGKSSTIVCRIKYLIDHGVDPERILMVTFNVDAAESLKNKIVELFSFMPKVTVGTIDSVACKFYHKYYKQPFRVNVSEYSYFFLKYLRSPGNLVSNLYHYVFFDEFQDVNEIQYNILKEFYNAGSYITVVGDSSQCIYQWRGSQIKYILNLDKYIKNLSTYALVNNYRSTPEIINLANYSIKFNKEQVSKEMVANHESINFLPHIRHYDNAFQQNNSIIKKILEFKEQGIEFEEIAILCRNNRPLKFIEEAIEKHNQKSNDNSIKYIALINDDSDMKPKVKSGHVTLTTIHKSKGLEFTVIILLDCVDSRFPSETDGLSIQEERRLFYVAMTRAKKYLYFVFCNDNKNKIPVKITRFIQELPRELYNFINYDKKFYSHDDYRSIKWVTGVTETLKLLNETDIAKLRESGILPIDEPIITKLHDKHDFNKFITGYYLHTDFGTFIDRYITRTIGYRNFESGGLIDNSAVIIIAGCQFTTQEVNIYQKYQNNFAFNMKKINSSTYENKYLEVLNENFFNLENFKNINNSEEQIIINIVQKLLLTANKYKIDIAVLVNCFTVKNEIPDDIKKEILESYRKYVDANNLSNEIKKEIYKISLCETILNGRRRLLYRDVYDHFSNGYDSLFNDIEKYIDTLDPEFTNLVSKKFIKNDEYDIMGEIDLININKSKIIDFKCSGTDNFKLEWLLQLLAYLAIVRKSYKEYNMNIVEIYNPLHGSIYTIDLSGWNKEDEYLAYLYEIRVRQISRNASLIVDTHNEDIEMNYPIKYCEYSDDDLDKINKYRGMIIKENIYDLNKLFGDEYIEYLEYIKKYNNKTIHEFEKYTNKRYIVLDTETTGLPKRQSIGNFPDYTELSNYNNARMIQICWAVYCNGKLEKLCDYYVKPNNFKIENTHIHGITDELCYKKGLNINQVLTELSHDIGNIKYIIGHNILFDYHIVCSELYRAKFNNILNIINEKELICTMEKSIPLKVDGCLKPARLGKLYKFLFGKEFENQHNAKYDVLATAEIFHELLKRKLVNY
ncbi:UvrD/REP helicase family protein [Indivirus ILV1]|uniref:DNA 3'-5' helicase n=1 Tax=Indivirus ILV1 TaxID=1977633 RepID=A0A1V0SDG5_9VIRU|nr:UvrD/REP helicase family protein [Indivirus ILV1]